jgi:CBS domain-containing protein
MNAKELMTPDPACCTRDTPVEEVARMMAKHDCGEIPVVERKDSKKVVGVVTDRDIVTRAVAEGKNPATLNVESVMSSPAVTVQERADSDEVTRTMESHQIRRVPVVDQDGELRGIIAQADVARHLSRHEAGELVRDVSQPK